MSLGWLKSKERGIARRAFLGGAGTVVALPLLESLLPRRARAAAATPPRRVLYYYVPCGINMVGWRPADTGPTYTLSPMLKPVEALRADFMVLTGTRNDPSRPNPGPGDHAAGTSGFITCATALKSASEFKLGISIDQVAAQTVGMNTRVPYAALGIDGGALAGSCDSGFGCPYSRAISWSGPTTPLPKVTDPKTAFNLIFMGFDPTASQSDQLRRTKYRKSVLDVVTAQAQGLKPRLGTSDKAKLDEYFTSVSEVERQVTTVSTNTCNTGTPPDATATMTFEKQMDAMNSIMVLAMQCDVTRIFSFMLGNAASQRVYNNLGITRGHHDISHHGGQQANLDMLQTIGTYEVTLLNNLLTKMKMTMDGDADLLFNSTVYFSSEISDGDAHNHDDLPVLIAGHGGGIWNTGQHYKLPTTTKVSDVLTTTLRTLGISDAKLGDSDGPEMAILKA